MNHKLSLRIEAATHKRTQYKHRQMAVVQCAVACILLLLTITLRIQRANERNNCLVCFYLFQLVPMYINREHNKFPLARNTGANAHARIPLSLYHPSIHIQTKHCKFVTFGLEHALRTQTPSDTIYDDAKSERFCVRACTCVHRIDNNITHPMLIHHSHMAHTAHIRFSSHLLFYFRVASFIHGVRSTDIRLVRSASTVK